MRFLPCLALTAFLTFLSGACTKQESRAEASLAAKPLSAEPAMLDLGRVNFGERVSGTYRLQNQTGKVLPIVRIGPFSCQCASAELLLPGRQGEQAKRRLDGGRINLELQPDEVMELVFTLDTARYRQPASRKIGSIPIIFRDHPGMVLEWGADIYTPFAVEPWLVDLKEIGVRQRASGTALVVAHDSTSFNIDIDQIEEDGWKVESRKVEVANSRLTFELTFTAPEVLPEGPFSRAFRLQTDLQDAPPIKITVQGIAQADLSFSPSRLVFDPARERLDAQLIVVNRAQGGNLDRLDLSAWEAAGFEIVDQDAPDAGTLGLHLRYTGEADTTMQNLSIPITTGDEETPVLEVPVTIMPQRKQS
ncbi:MAG: hypothetical protein ACPG31_09250 [Planctomycetota bacterium]